MNHKHKASIPGPILIAWQHLVYAVQQYAQDAPVGELADYDADRLMQAARTIQARLRAAEPGPHVHKQPGPSLPHHPMIPPKQGEGVP